MPFSPPKVRPGLVTMAAAAAFLVKLALAWNTYGTNDVLFWERNLAKIRADGGVGLYRDGAQIFRGGVLYQTEPFNQPPFMVHALLALGFLTDRAGVPLGFGLRLASSLADIGSLALVARILARTAAPYGLLLVALSPVAIMASGFHGNTDGIMIFWALLSIWLVESGKPAWLAGAALGMAMNIKVIPILFAPAALLYLRSMRSRAAFAAGAGVVFAAGSAPYLAQEPLLVLNRVFGYSSLAGHWGFSRLIRVVTMTTTHGIGLYEAYLRIGKLFALAALVAAAIWMNRRDKKPSLFLQYGCIAFLFLFLTPGFAVQHLAWLVPWCAALSGWPVWLFWGASGAFLLEVYTYWSRGWPWYRADMLYTADLQGSLLYFFLETLCWVAVGCVVFRYWRTLRGTEFLQTKSLPKTSNST